MTRADTSPDAAPPGRPLARRAAAGSSATGPADAPRERTDQRQDQRQDHRQEQRKRILDAAVACFGRDGFHGASMQKICAEAGMSPGALYRYFPSKESIIAAIVESERADRVAILDSIARAPSVLAALTECLRLVLTEAMFASARLGPEIMAEAIRNADLRAAVEPHEHESRCQLRNALAIAVTQGEVDPELDLDMVVLMLQLIGDGLILHGQLHPEWKLLERLPALETLVRRMVGPPRPVSE
ncbi:helix-turn-helix domain-containing protein [Xanthobacter sp. KR7-65]|uniref:TetR/AcrR family transcriptional regulator n=1 Tax=Xanthobacter sp. KR7-65 TaxID=3156612 RepID=UPI0032B4E2BE